LDLECILITHTHGDHIAVLDILRASAGTPAVYTNELEPLKDAILISAGHRFTVGKLTIEARLTNGHSPGGTTYIISGLKRPVAIVGDSIFCTSQGGAPGNYHQALENNRREILSLPDDTIICPGHGPLTTVANERAHNPFFSEFK
jgi:hydroxyacylglutathione hydrolase